MPAFQCAFCDHANPVGAKFCNACGSPLNLKPCAECDAVNEDTATACYKCGADLRNPQLEMAVSPASESLVEPALAANVEADHKPSLEAAADILVTMPASLALGAGSAERHETNLASRDHRNWRQQVFGMQWTTRPSGIASSTSGAASEDGRPTLLKASLTSLVVIALAVSTHYVYRQQAVGPDTRSADARSPSIPGGAQPAAVTAGTSASDGVSGPQSGSAGNAVSQPEADSDQATNTASAQRERGNDTGNDAGTERPTNDGTEEAPVPSATPVDAPVAAQAPVAPTDIAAPANAPKISAAPPDTQSRSTRQGAAHSSTNRPPAPGVSAGIRAPSREVGSRGSSRETRRIAQCTEAVAALGFCNREAQGESR